MLPTLFVGIVALVTLVAGMVLTLRQREHIRIDVLVAQAEVHANTRSCAFCTLETPDHMIAYRSVTPVVLCQSCFAKQSSVIDFETGRVMLV